MSNRLCVIAGGGTGGHLMPALTLAGLIRQQFVGVKVTFVGARRGLEAKLLPARNEEVLLLEMHGVQGFGLGQKLKVVGWQLPKAVWQLMNNWRKERPALVIGVGGYASVAAIIAASVARIPVVLYEQNAMPGMVNRTMARFCRVVMLGFEAAARHLPGINSVVTGNVTAEAIRQITWQPHTPPRLLVVGGSQGAKFLNEMIPAACGLLKAGGHHFVVSHIAGPEREASVLAAYQAAGIEAEVSGFCQQMAQFYGKGDLLIARSGAMTVAEASAAGLPALYVPLPTAADHHQHHNASAIISSGGARLLEQQEQSVESVATAIAALLFAPQQLETMSRAARAALPDNVAERQLAVLRPWLEVNP